VPGVERTVKMTAFEALCPGFETVIEPTPTDARRVAGMIAARSLGALYVVDNAVPFQETTEDG
jgi:hypothetical protein